VDKNGKQITNIIQQNEPKSKLIRVGIGTNNFASYFWQEATIYATADYDLYENSAIIDTLTHDETITIIRDGKNLILTNNKNEKILTTTNPVRFKSTFGNIGIKDLKRAGVNAVYRGEIEIVPCVKENQFHIVNEIEVEQYLKGVVPNEMPVRFGLEALKAQSVAARNYVLSPRIKLNPNYDVVDSVASQVYFGANTEKELSNQAVKETEGIVALYGWDMILAQYSSTAGGWSESFENVFSDVKTKAFPSESKPYLVAKPDYDEFKPLDTEEKVAEFYKTKPKSFDINSPYFRWEREWNGQDIQDAVQANIANQSSTGFVTPAVEKDETIGIIQALNIKKRGLSGKIMELEIQTDKQNYIVQKELVIRRLLTNKGKALPSANVVFEQEYNEDGQLIYIKAYGGGYGHGVGLSQYGAGYMGTELGMTYDKILKHYYSNITLATEPLILSADEDQTRATQTFYSKNGNAILVVDNKFKVKYIDVNINNIDKRIEFDKSERYNQIDLSQDLKCGENTIKFYYPESKGGLRLYIEFVGEDDRNISEN
jgi:SpoIID/LytB domain protein